MFKWAHSIDSKDIIGGDTKPSINTLPPTIILPPGGGWDLPDHPGTDPGNEIVFTPPFNPEPVNTKIRGGLVTDGVTKPIEDETVFTPPFNPNPTETSQPKTKKGSVLGLLAVGLFALMVLTNKSKTKKKKNA